MVVDALWGLGYLSEDAPQYAIDSKALGHVRWALSSEVRMLRVWRAFEEIV